MIYFQNKSFVVKAQHELSNGVNIAVLPLESSALIIVSENVTKEDHDMNIYEFSQKNGLQVIQQIKCSLAVDVALW